MLFVSHYHVVFHCVDGYTSWFILPHAGGHLDCVHFEATLRIKLLQTFFFMSVGGHGLSFFLGTHLGVESWVIGVYVA